MRTILLACAIWCLPLVSHAAVAFGSCTQFESAGCTNCDITTHTVASGENFLVVFTHTDGTTPTQSSASWDQAGSPQSMTEQANMATGALRAKAWTLENPTVGNLTLRVVQSGSGTMNAQICSFSGYGSLGTVVETEQTATDSGDSLAFTINSGGMAVAYLGTQFGVSAFTQGADQTQRLREPGTGCGGANDCDATTTTATVSPMDYTWTSSSADYWHVVIPMNAVARPPSAPILLGWLMDLLTPDEAYAY